MPNTPIQAMKADTTKPKNYKPLSLQQRNEWNGFLHNLYTQGLSGDPSLDEGEDQTAKMINAYRSANPNFSITPDMIPNIQYEMQQMQKGMIPNPDGTFSDVNKGVGSLIANNFNGKIMSKVDGRIGSLTSAEPYPIVSMNGRTWGTDYNKFISDIGSYMTQTGAKFNTNSAGTAMNAMASNP